MFSQIHWKTVNHCHDDDEQITINDIIDQRDINGKPNVVIFRITARVLLQQFYNQQRKYPEEEKIRLIQTDAKRIKDDIKAVQITHNM